MMNDQINIKQDSNNKNDLDTNLNDSVSSFSNKDQSDEQKNNTNSQQNPNEYSKDSPNNPNDYQNNNLENIPTDNLNEYLDNNNYNNIPNEDTKNTDQGNLIETKTASQLAFKTNIPKAKSIINSNSYQNLPEDENVTKFKLIFEEKHKNKEYKTICFDITNYSKSGTENCFVKFDRSSKGDFNVSKSGYFKIMQRASSEKLPKADRKSDGQFFSKSLSSENYKKTINLEMKVKLNQLNQLYLAHLYEKVPATFNKLYLVDQINFYMANECIALAHLHGFSMTDYEGNFFPTVLTDRPVNGPLSSLFESIKENQSKKEPNDDSDSFNIGKIRSINSEQKFALICGITRALSFIHGNRFIHSNLNPATVYLDENLFPVVCDYIFIPSFQVTYNDDDKVFRYKFEKEPDNDSFQNILYVSPEMRNCEVFGPSADIYSLGLIIYFILAEQEAEPFDDENGLKFPDGFGEKWKELIKRCVSKDPKKRPTASEILEKELFDMKKLPDYFKSIDPKSVTLSISETTNLYLILLKNEGEPVFNIFKKMVPNIADIDYETKLIIMAAEKGNADCLDKVGDFFFKGQNNLHKDESWAYDCFVEGSNRGNAHSSFFAAQFNENGVGIHVNLSKAIFFYNRALGQITEKDPRRSKIESKIKKLEELNKILVICNIPFNKTPQDIKKMFPKIEIEVSPIPPSKDEQETSQKMKIKFKSNEELNQFWQEVKCNPQSYKIGGNIIELKLPYSTRIKYESHRYKSLSPSLEYIELDDYCLKMENNQKISLGSGHYADTFLVYKKGSNEIYAAKVFKNPLNITKINLLKREILMSSNLNHPCILKYVGFNEHSLIQYYENGSTREIMPTLLMEFIPNGTLENAIRQRIDGFNDTVRLKIIIGIASALNEMFVNNIIHRDLKPSNILLNKNFEPVICDLGLSRQFTNLIPNKMTDKVGTPIYMAPELSNGLNGPLYYKSEVDVYSFGIILFQILTFTKSSNVYPECKFLPAKILELKLSSTYVPELLDKFEMNQVFKNLIFLCWNIEKDERPDPPTIYKTLVDTVRQSTHPLLPDANMDEVNKYINILPKI